MTRGASLAATRNEPLQLGLINIVSTLPRPPKSLLLILGVLVLAIVVVSQRQSLLGLVDHEIEVIKVQGNLNQLSVERVESSLERYLGSSFLMTDLQQVKASVEALPWVYQSTVSRVWPAEIQVTVNEQVPVGYWNASGYLNAQGDIFTPANFSVANDLPKLSGPLASEQHVRVEMLATMTNLQALLQVYELNAAELQLKPRGVWDVILSNGMLVALGKRPFESKIERLGAVLSRVPESAVDRIKEVDARYPNGVAVKWKEIVVASKNGS